EKWAPDLAAASWPIANGCWIPTPSVWRPSATRTSGLSADRLGQLARGVDRLGVARPEHEIGVAPRGRDCIFGPWATPLGQLEAFEACRGRDGVDVVHGVLLVDEKNAGRRDAEVLADE